MIEKDCKNMSTTSRTGDIRCPFFVAHNEKEIACESTIDGRYSSDRFKTMEEKQWFLNTYCENNYKMCPKYQSIIHWNWNED